MSTADSTTNVKPAKPYPEFPLYAHASGRWAKKIRGKTHFFGKWEDPQGALRKFLAEEDDLKAGRIPVHGEEETGVTVEEMVFRFLAAQKLRVESGDLELRTWDEYEGYGDRLIRVFGPVAIVEKLGPTDFRRLRADFQRTHKSPKSILGDIRKTKRIFNWAGPEQEGLLDRMPRFGDGFKPPGKRAMRAHKEAQGDRSLAAARIRGVLDVAHLKLRAMILLGINCGYGNMDCVRLTMKRLDLENGFINFPRTKNLIPRRCPLWPETAAALHEVLRTRKKPKKQKHAQRVFVTQFGQGYKAENLSRDLKNALERAGFGREGRFYDLRRTCSSIGMRVKDDDAMRTIMGHTRHSDDMLAVYNQLSVSDDRLLAVTQYIHDWLWGESVAQTPAVDAPFWAASLDSACL